MKKAIITLSVLIIFGLVGGLYYSSAQTDKLELVTTEWEDTVHSSFEATGFVLEPLSVVPLY